MPRLLSALCVALALPAWAGPVWAGDFTPGGNSGALARGFALPSLGDLRVLPRGLAETRLTADVANEYVREGYAANGSCPGECITLDGETSRLRLAHRRGLGGGWEIGVELPLLDRGGGFLDGWIQDWHGWFGLPNGGRELAADDQYRFRYERGSVALLDETEAGSGIGDATLTVGKAVGEDTALRLMAKLPTGDEDELAGGNAGGALWLEHALPFGYVAFGASLSGRGAVLPEMQNREVFFGGLGLLVPVTDSMRLTAQLQLHSLLYDGSELSPFSRPGAPLTLGLQFRAGERHTIELGFQEDPSVNASPDFSAYLSLTRR